MNVRGKAVQLVLVLVLLSGTTAPFASVNPDWYTVNFYQDPFTESGEWNLRDGYSTGVYFGQVQVLPSNLFYSTPGAVWNGDITLVITSPFPTYRFSRAADDTIYYPIELNILRNGSTPQTEGKLTEGPSEVQLNLSQYDHPTFHFIMDIEVPNDNANWRRGYYFTSFSFSLFVDYGKTTEQQIGSDLFVSTSYFFRQDSGGQTVHTNLLVDRYSTASDIDVPTLQRTQGSLKVAGINFFSDDSGDTSYKINISPGENPNGVFAFHRTNGSSPPIPYRVFVPLRYANASSDREFSIPVTTTTPSGVWQDTFELGITRVNENGVNYTTGEFTSLIQIELVSN